MNGVFYLLAKSRSNWGFVKSQSFLGSCFGIPKQMEGNPYNSESLWNWLTGSKMFCFVPFCPLASLRRSNCILHYKSFLSLFLTITFHDQAICLPFSVIITLDKPPFCWAQQPETNSVFNIPAIVVVFLARLLVWKLFDMWSQSTLGFLVVVTDGELYVLYELRISEIVWEQGQHFLCG